MNNIISESQETVRLSPPVKRYLDAYAYPQSACKCGKKRSPRVYRSPSAIRNGETPVATEMEVVDLAEIFNVINRLQRYPRPTKEEQFAVLDNLKETFAALSGRVKAEPWLIRGGRG